MTSAKKIAANRRNALRSTGPRTGAGKARSRGNALKHGLAVPIALDSLFADRIKALTEELGSTIPDSADRIRLAACACAELERVQVLWAKLMDGEIASACLDAIGGGEQSDGSIHSTLQFLPKLTRYERRAISKLGKTLRNLKTA